MVPERSCSPCGKCAGGDSRYNPNPAGPWRGPSCLSGLARPAGAPHGLPADAGSSGSHGREEAGGVALAEEEQRSRLEVIRRGKRGSDGEPRAQGKYCTTATTTYTSTPSTATTESPPHDTSPHLCNSHLPLDMTPRFTGHSTTPPHEAAPQPVGPRPAAAGGCGGICAPHRPLTPCTAHVAPSPHYRPFHDYHSQHTCTTSPATDTVH